ncbi:hypothetical protein CDG81_12530 [Actinopolyspora erythraea]|uniref:Class F sortase n=1 Tax=Actinopolyspora erythraea TaxID=414996 RepID=A0A099D538_9ACTN|nr:hypothetical protein [Actinopolyspora erythraea]ASU78975.1 hypothetical protein CDG81_12530 [Actinopolyspora erythraea]KGI81308.1 hypothetical protein IL38_12610 [Actinopolyspora erythraea]
MNNATRLGIYCGVLVLVGLAGWGVGSLVDVPEGEHPGGQQHGVSQRLTGPPGGSPERDVL